MFDRKKEKMPVDLVYGNPNPACSNETDYVAKLEGSLQFAYEQARVNTGHNLERQKEFYDCKGHCEPHEPGDLVWLHNLSIPRGGSPKPWSGPFRVVKRLLKKTLARSF